jgi:hypothetical protein
MHLFMFIIISSGAGMWKGWKANHNLDGRNDRSQEIQERYGSALTPEAKI